MNNCAIFGLLVLFLSSHFGSGMHFNSNSSTAKPNIDLKMGFCRVFCTLRKNETTCFILNDNSVVSACIYYCMQFLGENITDAKPCQCKNEKCIDASTTNTTSTTTTTTTTIKPSS